MVNLGAYQGDFACKLNLQGCRWMERGETDQPDDLGEFKEFLQNQFVALPADFAGNMQAAPDPWVSERGFSRRLYPLLFPHDGEGEVRIADVPWGKRHVEGDFTAPRPALAWGFPEIPSEYSTMIDRYREFLSPYPNFAFPFLAVEMKAPEGYDEDARCEALGTAACAIRGYLTVACELETLASFINKIMFVAFIVTPEIISLAYFWAPSQTEVRGAILQCWGFQTQGRLGDLIAEDMNKHITNSRK
ncbi:MAG: hypothetical protein M1833_006290 [Piccolia ochrophora]|nr:MAG: hypothetical protein M1833_006290 [Piccolia ochrophora]